MTERELLLQNKFRRSIEVEKNSPKSYIYNEKKAENMARLHRYEQMWDNLSTYRKNAVRNKNFTFGKQWEDKVRVNGRYISEEENIIRQGKAPLINNMLRQLVKTVVGAFRENKVEPQAISRDRDEQKLGEMMSIALQYAHQINSLHELDARCFESFLIKGVACQIVSYCWDKLRVKKEVHVKSVNPYSLFFNGDIEDPRGEDLTCIGFISDAKLSEVIQSFARNEKDALRIASLYSEVRYNDAYSTNYDALDGRNKSELDFYRPNESDKVRVIEAWELESKERVYCHDKERGENYLIEKKDLHHIERENQARMSYYVSMGVPMEDVLEKNIIETEWMWDTFWYVRYLTPNGDVLAEMETPFSHREHPFAFIAYPLIDGEVHPFISDMIDQQKLMNRLLTLQEFILGASAKGVLVFPEDALGNMSKEEVLKEWVKYNGVIFAKIKPGMPMPQQIVSNATNVGIIELVQLQMKLLQDISGVHGALQGKAPTSGTAASLYAQESQNAATNLLDLYDSFNEFRKRRDYKMMKVIQQYYDAPRYIGIAGHDYSNEAKYYNPSLVRDSDMDIIISESIATPAYRMAMNNFLMQIYQMGQLDLKTMLQHAAYPFSDKLIDAIDKKEKEMAAQQQAMTQQQMPEEASELSIPSEVEEQADPKVMEYAKQFLGQ